MSHRPSASVVVQTEQGARRLELHPATTLRDTLLNAGFAIRSTCGGDGSCGLCVVGLAESALIPFTPAERSQLDAQQLADGLRLACQIKTEVLAQDSILHVTLKEMQRAPRWRELPLSECSSIPLPVPLRAAPSRYGVAVDLGTTHIRLTLWDVQRGIRLGGRVGLNPQRGFGVDVLSRLMEAMTSPVVAGQIRDLAAQAIGDALREMAATVKADPREIGEVLVVGNTAMLTLLAGSNFELLMQPENWEARITCEPEQEYLRRQWGLAGHAQVSFIQPLGGLIGSDLLAGVLVSGLMQHKEATLLIDFGTNSEMALWDGLVLRVTSAAGGPAFEGSGISCGMPGESGAIYRVQRAGEGGFKVQVLGDVPAQGICSSGLVDAVALLLQAGTLDRVGRLRPGMAEAHILEQGERRIALQKADIDVLQRAKAAIGAGVSWLCAQAGLSSAGLRRVYATGAFGRLLDVAHAQQIGLLPQVGAGDVQLLANSALAGCEMLLLAADREQLLAGVHAVTEVHNLAEDEQFEMMFVNNLYLQPMQA